LFDVPLLIARLQALPDGDKNVGAKAIDNAIRILKTKDEPKLLAKAYVLRAATGDDAAAHLADFQAAVKADPESAEALQGLSLIYLSQGKNDEAVATLRKLVETGSSDPAAIGILAEALTNQKKYDEALDYCKKLIEVKPKSTLGYQLRARIHILKEELKAANEDLDEALKVDDEDVQSLLMRSQVLAALGKEEQAKADIDKAVALDPDQPQAILLRAMIAAQSGNFGRAITDMQTLIHSDPTNTEYRLRLATFYNADKRPRKAIQLLDDVVRDEPKNAEALQARADANLSISKQKEAIEDYEKSLKLEGDNTGVLNNLAWVMATSPEADLRNGKRAIELATKACELTKYEKPHIISTLASAYAEAGDWDNAVKWSSKAVELGEGEIKDQLKQELKSYQEKKPWRESQTVEENTAPIEPKKNDLET
jgi:tetratricopeptide (TPR) repeat protein